MKRKRRGPRIKDGFDVAKVLVSIEVPPGITRRQMADYVKAALVYWGCQFPDSPLNYEDRWVKVKIWSTLVGEGLKDYRIERKKWQDRHDAFTNIP